MEWRKYINMGIVPHTLVAEEMEDEKRILEIYKQMAKDYFFDFIEIIELKDKNLRHELKKIILESHLEAVFSTGYTVFTESLDINSTDKNIRKKSVDRIKELILLSNFFCAGNFGILSGLNVPESDRENAKEILTESLLEICEYAKKNPVKDNRPVTLTMETFDTKFTHKMLMGPTADAVQVIKKVRKYYNNIYLMLDSGHLPLIGEDFKTAISTGAPYLRQVHCASSVLKNTKDPKFGDTHPYFGYPGSEVDTEQLKEFLSLLKKYNFFHETIDTAGSEKLPLVSFEVVRKGSEDIELLVANAKRTFSKAWSMVF